jgi:hypothetical protein
LKPDSVAVSRTRAGIGRKGDKKPNPGSCCL